MANGSECYAALCAIRSILVTALSRSGYDVDANDCYHMCITDLANLCADYTGKVQKSDDLDIWIATHPAGEEHLYEVVFDEVDGSYITCIEVEEGVYDWVELGTLKALISQTITEDGTYIAKDYGVDGFSEVRVDTSAHRNMQNKTVTPNDDMQAIVADKGFGGLGTVTVRPVPTETCNVIPTAEAQEIVPSNGKYFSKVYADAIINQNKSVIPAVSEQVIGPDAGYNGLIEVRVAGEPHLLPENIISGIDIFGVVGNASSTQRSGQPIIIATADEMNVRRNLASSDTLGTIYKYTGNTQGEYANNMLYIIEAEQEAYVMKKLSIALIKLDAPSVSIDGDTISWEAIPYATRYIVYRDTGAVLGYSEGTTFTLTSRYPGTMNVYVVAAASGYDSSFASNSIVWSPTTIRIYKHGNIPFDTDGNYNLATSFDNKAVFCCIGTSNKLMAIDTNFISSAYEAPSWVDTIAATDNLLFLTDDTNFYSYTTDMVMSSAILLTQRNGKAAARIGSNIIYAGGYDNNNEVFVVNAEAIDDELVVKSISNIPYGQDGDLVACSTPKYAVFLGNPSICFAYDENLLQTVVSNVALAVSSNTMATANTGSYALFAGGYSYTEDANGEGYGVYSSTIYTFDENLVVGNSINLLEPRSNSSGVNLNGYALFGGGTYSYDYAIQDSSYVDAFDANLNRVYVDGQLSVGGGSLGAATTGLYAIFGATTNFKYADIFTTEIT